MLFQFFPESKYNKINTRNKLIMDSTTQGTQTYLLNQNKLKKPRCSSDYQATQICLNPNCQASFQSKKRIKLNEQNNLNSIKTNNNPFICSNPECRTCFYTNDIQLASSKTEVKRAGVHSRCFTGEYDNLLSSLQQKKIDFLPLKDSINKIFDNFIEYLSALRQKYIGELKYLGFSQNQKKFCSCFQNEQYDQVTPQLSFSIVKSLDQQITVDILLIKQKLEDYWLKQEKKVKNFFEKVGNIVFKKATRIVNQASIGSKIMIFDKQEEDLIKMLQDRLEKPVQQLTLLYRASQNDFDAKKFHQKCDLIRHTVVVIQTEHGKKIGGYTPLMWDKKKSGYQEDASGKSFVFSLSNNHMFTLLKSLEKYAIVQEPNYGPIFGYIRDIGIVDKGNKNQCQAKIGNYYTNPEYQNNHASWTKFSGAIGTSAFKVRQWEVFQIKWN